MLQRMLLIKYIAKVMNNLILDTHRPIAPLKMCRDSIKLDTSDMSIEEVVAEMRRIVKEKIPV